MPCVVKETATLIYKVMAYSFILCIAVYRILGNFRGTKFSRFRVNLFIREKNFRVSLP